MLSGTNPRTAGLGGQLQAATHVALECEVLLLEPGCLVHWILEDDVELEILQSSFHF